MVEAAMVKIGKTLGILPIFIPLNRNSKPYLFLFLLLLPKPGIPNRDDPFISIVLIRFKEYSFDALFREMSVTPPEFDCNCLVQLVATIVKKHINVKEIFFVIFLLKIIENKQQ
jgi:hypothetical protein